MEILICGAGQVGSYAAEILSQKGHAVTVVDTDRDRLRALTESLDLRTLHGNVTDAGVLREAGVADAGLVLAATASDEVNLLTASIAKALGAGRAIARVHSGVYFEGEAFDYGEHFGADELICPEFAAAEAILSALRNPGAMAIETFAHGQIELHVVPVAAGSDSVEKPLSEVRMPRGSRLLCVRRDGHLTLPSAETRVRPGDAVIIVANQDVFPSARRLFDREQIPRRRVAVLGASPIAHFLCRTLAGHAFTVKVFEPDRERAEAMALKIEGATVISGDPTDPATFDEEHIGEFDAFVAATDDDESNILACAFAKSRGVHKAYAVVQKRRYMHLLHHVAIDRAFSPRIDAAKEVLELVEDRPVRRVAVIQEGELEAFQVRVGTGVPGAHRPLREITELPGWIAAAVEHGEETRVPTPDSVLEPGDRVIVVGPPALEPKLREVLVNSKNGPSPAPTKRRWRAIGR